MRVTVPPTKKDNITVRQEARERKRKPAVFILNTAISVLVLVTGYYSYAFISNKYFAVAPPSPDSLRTTVARTIQLDVINGCGARNVGSKFTEYLRAHGFDVVEVKNYKSSHIPNTLVVDRVGDLDAARRVAAALGVDSQNVVQQLNRDYFVDVSVILGDDYASLPHPN